VVDDATTDLFSPSPRTDRRAVPLTPTFVQQSEK
jgi:hypothetical protein